MATISKELGYVYFTSTGDVYAKLKDAEKHQAEINYTRESKQMIERRLLMSGEYIKDIKRKRMGCILQIKPNSYSWHKGR